MNSGRVTLSSGHSCSDSVKITIPCKVYILLRRLLMQPSDCLTQRNTNDIEIT